MNGLCNSMNPGKDDSEVNKKYNPQQGNSDNRPPHMDLISTKWKAKLLNQEGKLTLLVTSNFGSSGETYTKDVKTHAGGPVRFLVLTGVNIVVGPATRQVRLLGRVYKSRFLVTLIQVPMLAIIRNGLNGSLIDQYLCTCKLMSE